MNNKFGEASTSSCDFPLPTHQENWEVQLDAIIKEGTWQTKMSDFDVSCLKTFISHLLAEARKEERGSISEIIKEEKKYWLKHSAGNWAGGAIEGLNYLLTKLNQNE